MTQEANNVAIKSFNSNHESYDQLRPSFGPVITKAFLQDLKLMKDETPDPEKVILELAAGTGKFTKNLLDLGWSKNLIIVEPSEGMLKTFRQNFPEITAHQGSSYRIPLPDNSVDSIVIAQGFHWFSDTASLKEMRRVLKSSGTFGCIWNFDGCSKPQQSHKPEPQVSYYLDETIPFDPPTDPAQSFEFSKKAMATHPWNKDVTDYMYSFDVNVPQYRQGIWKPLLMENDYFKPIQKENYSYQTSLIEQASVYKYWLTRSYITDLEDDEKVKVEQKINDILKQSVVDSDKVIKGETVYLKRIMGTHTVATELA